MTSFPITATTIRSRLRELDDQIRQCRDEIAATASDADDDLRAQQNLSLGSLTSRRIVTLQWL